MDSCPASLPVDLSEISVLVDPHQPFQFPIANYHLAQSEAGGTNFANSGNELAYDRKYHAAEDILNPAGTPVYAMADGRISYSGPKGGYGWLIIIDHPQANLYSLYGHLSPSRWRKESGPVARGEVIGYLGDTHENGSGGEYGQFPPHLHFGVRTGQRGDYPGAGDWRWQAGWVKSCPQDLGWQQPSILITNQEIPSGGYTNPTGSLLTIWAEEFITIGALLVFALLSALIWFKMGKPFLLILGGGAFLVIGIVFYNKGMRFYYLLPAAGALLAALGVYCTSHQYRHKKQTSAGLFSQVD